MNLNLSVTAKGDHLSRSDGQRGFGYEMYNCFIMQLKQAYLLVDFLQNIGLFLHTIS